MLSSQARPSDQRFTHPLKLALAIARALSMAATSFALASGAMLVAVPGMAQTVNS
jgi:hypothetical protein